MRIAWVKVGPLWPLHTGGRIRSFNILKELSRRHEISVVTTHGPEDDPEAIKAQLPGCVRLASFPHKAPKHGTLPFAREVLRSWLSPLPADIRKWRVPGLLEGVTRLLQDGEVDLCVADFLTSVVNVPLEGPVPTVLFEHNVEHVIWKRLSQTSPVLWRRLLLEVEWRKMRRFEARACERVALTLAVSEADRDLLQKTAPGARVEAIPTGVDVAYFTPNSNGESPSIVFTGSLDWYPNEDGILHFADAILPLIRREVPLVSVTVVGRNPSPRLKAAAASARIRLTGRVDDVRPYVAEAAVFVVPLRVGGGTRLKIFEALAMGKALVSTAVGAEGLPLAPGEHFLQADDPTSFATAVLSLLRNPARRRALGAAGRRLVEERYSWSRVARDFEARCAEVTTGAASMRFSNRSLSTASL